MIRECSGDILGAATEALVNPVNTAGVMGKGLALQFKRAYPVMFADYLAACRQGDLQVGRVMVHKVSDAPQYVVNFPTKQHWRDPSRLEWISDGLTHLCGTLRELGARSIAIPPLGCGLGGLNWTDVRNLIIQELQGLRDVDIVLYVPKETVR